MHDLTAGGAGAEPAALPLRPFRGDLDWPVGRNPSPAGPASQAGAATPNAIVIAAPEGAPVAAVHDGVVAFADAFGGFGNLVIVDHGSQSFSLYGDLLEMSVKKGARIERGRAIGTVGPAPATARALLRVAHRRSIRSIPYNGSNGRAMSSRTRAIVLAITAPVVVFAIVGGLLGTVMAREDTSPAPQNLRRRGEPDLEQVLEPVNIDKVMKGAMNGLVDSLDPDSAYLSSDEVKQAESGSGVAGRQSRDRADAPVLPSRAGCSATTRPPRRPGCARATTCAPSTTCRRAT